MTPLSIYGRIIELGRDLLKGRELDEAHGRRLRNLMREANAALYMTELQKWHERPRCSRCIGFDTITLDRDRVLCLDKKCLHEGEPTTLEDECA